MADTDNIRLMGIELKLGTVETRLGGMENRLTAVEKDLDTLKGDSREIRGGIGGVKWLLGLFFIGGATLFLTLFFTFGKSYVRETAREVVREEMRGRQTVSQDGAFAAATAVEGSPNVFDWKLRQAVDPNAVVDIRVDLLSPLPGAMVTPQVTENGTHCRMTITLPPNTPLPPKIDAKVYITLAAAH